MWQRSGPAQLDALELPTGYAIRIDSLRDLIASTFAVIGLPVPVASNSL